MSEAPSPFGVAFALYRRRHILPFNEANGPDNNFKSTSGLTQPGAPGVFSLIGQIEQAHPAGKHIFYQIFEKDVLRDDEGRDIDFRNTIALIKNGFERTARAVRRRLGCASSPVAATLHSLVP